jgi:hypothetical protein
MSENVHVMPSDGGWDVTVEGRPGAEHFESQAEAMAVGQRLAQSNRSEHIVHSRDGRIRQRDAYGRDPFPLR